MAWSSGQGQRTGFRAALNDLDQVQRVEGEFATTIPGHLVEIVRITSKAKTIKDRTQKQKRLEVKTVNVSFIFEPF